MTRQVLVKLALAKIEPACGEHLPAPSAEDAVAFDAQPFNHCLDADCVNYLFRCVHALKYSGKKNRVNRKKLPLAYCAPWANGLYHSHSKRGKTMTKQETYWPLPKAPHTAALASLGGADMALSSSSAGIVAKFSSALGGVWVEQDPTPLGTTRVWRFVKGFGGAYFAEWCDHSEIEAGNPTPRFFGSQFTDKDFVLC